VKSGWTGERLDLEERETWRVEEEGKEGKSVNTEQRANERRGRNGDDAKSACVKCGEEANPRKEESSEMTRWHETKENEKASLERRKVKLPLLGRSEDRLLIDGVRQLRLPSSISALLAIDHAPLPTARPRSRGRRARRRSLSLG
jgi:hypothetical protein